MQTLDSGTPLDRKKISIDEDIPPIERLKPGSDHHEFVLSYLQKRIKASEDQMKKNYDRWNISERKHQAYINLPNYEKILKEMNDKGLPPSPTVIVFPYQYAVTSTIVTYLTRVFCGRSPIFTLSANNAATAANVKAMETALQYHAEHTKLIRTIFQALLDGQLYGVSVTRNTWKEEYNNRPFWRPTTAIERLAGATSPYQKDSKIVKTYSGNNVVNIDPYMFFPDPNVPMSMCAEKGEFVFWRDFIGKHLLLQEEQFGSIRYVENIPDSANAGSSKQWYNLSVRNLLTQGDSHAGAGLRSDPHSTRSYMIDQGSVNIIPAELGLGPEEVPVKYLFTIANGQQIIQAEPLSFDHGAHPIAVSEPYTMGYGFAQPSLSDYIGPIQDIVSWFLDSHIYNVRTALNNMWIVDPSKVEMQDVLNPKPGKVIRLKPSAVGADVRTVMQQLPVTDVTRAHVSDMDAFIRIGDTVSAVNENLRGLQESGGRKTATEIRVSGDSASSRLAALGQLISAQQITEIARQMSMNIQQFQDEDMMLKLSGGEWSTVTPMGLSGDYLYPIHDGTLPIDKVDQFDVWREILTGVAQDQELRAHNISSFKNPAGGQPQMPQMGMDIQNPQQIQQGVQAGNLLPLNGATQ